MKVMKAFRFHTDVNTLGRIKVNQYIFKQIHDVSFCTANQLKAVDGVVYASNY